METPRLFCTFRLKGDLYGVNVLDVKEITTETSCTRIAHAPDEVLGLVNIRGHIHLALDLRSLMGMPRIPLNGDSRLVLFKPSVGSSFGVVVDEISDIHTADADRIEPFSATHYEVVTARSGRVDLIDAICKLPDELIVVLDPRKFLTVVEQQFTRSA